MSDIATFIRLFAEQFDEKDAAGFGPDTVFQENRGWDSMTALAVIAMADENYGVILTGEEVRQSQTIRDIYKFIESKKQAG